METTTAAAEFTAAVTRYFHIGPRTRRYRKGLDLHSEIIDAIVLAATVSGYYSEQTQRGLSAAFAPALGYRKHIKGYRVSGATNAKVQAMSPYRFTQMLAQMIDEGVSNSFEAELFFGRM